MIAAGLIVMVVLLVKIFIRVPHVLLEFIIMHHFMTLRQIFAILPFLIVLQQFPHRLTQQIQPEFAPVMGIKLLFVNVLMVLHVINAIHLSHYIVIPQEPWFINVKFVGVPPINQIVNPMEVVVLLEEILIVVLTQIVLVIRVPEGVHLEKVREVQKEVTLVPPAVLHHMKIKENIRFILKYLTKAAGKSI